MCCGNILHYQFNHIKHTSYQTFSIVAVLALYYFQSVDKYQVRHKLSRYISCLWRQKGNPIQFQLKSSKVIIKLRYEMASLVPFVFFNRNCFPRPFPQRTHSTRFKKKPFMFEQVPKKIALWLYCTPILYFFQLPFSFLQDPL